MGILRRSASYVRPMSRVGLALWAWRNRYELLGWADFTRRSLRRVGGGERADVIAEARLRARLTADHRTRSVDGLRVTVTDGVATLSGMVDPEIHDAAVAVATNTTGVARVRDELTESSRRRGRPRR
jgi:BON domain